MIKYRNYISILILIILSTNPNPTSITQAQETSSLYEYGPYNVGWIYFQNISKISGKKLPVSVYYPADETGLNSEPNKVDSPYPTIPISPGVSCGFTGYANLGKMLSSWGFCTILVGSTTSANDTERADDLAITLDWLTTLNDNSSSPFHQLFDLSRLGVAGHSGGGNGAIIMASRDSRIKTVVSISPITLETLIKLDLEKWIRYVSLSFEMLSDIDVPVLLALGSNDDVDNLESVPLMYDEFNSPKFLVTTSGDDHTSVRQDSISFKYIAMFCKVYLSGEEEYASYLYGEHAQQDVDEGLIELIYDVSEGTGDETQEPVEEVTTHQPEAEDEPEVNGGIPGYPLWSIGVALLLVSIIIARSQKH